MKSYLYRTLGHPRQSPEFEQAEQTPTQMTQVLDQKLHYINRSFKHNLEIQQIFLDITKTKRALHSKQIKEYYKLFTENKADSEIFHNTIQEPNKQSLEQFMHIKQAGRSLKRLYCRLIEKIMVKVSYYLMNKQKLGFINKEVNDLMRKCETLMRRINSLKDLHSINELIQEIYKENEEMQIRIIEELIDKGFIISIDEFYRINGVDLVDKELYERVKSEINEETDSDEDVVRPKGRMESYKKFQFNLNKMPSFTRMKKEEPVKKKEKKKPVHRMGYIEIENKYRDLLVHLENLIKNDLIDEIAEEREESASSGSQCSNICDDLSEKESEYPRQSIQTQNQDLRSSIKDKSDLSMKLNRQSLEGNTNSGEGEVEGRSSQISQNYHKPKVNQYTKKSLAQRSSKEFWAPEYKSELRQKKITLESGTQSNSYVSDVLNNRGSRANSKERKADFFSMSFMKALKTIEKVNLNDKTNRLAIKRMSQHIMAFHRQQQLNANAEPHRNSHLANLKNVLRRNNEKKSIIKLINLYKSRKLQQEIHSMQKQFDEYKDKLINKDQMIIEVQKTNKVSIFGQQTLTQLNEVTEQKTIKNITNYPKILDSKKSPKISPHKSNQYQRNPIFKHLSKDLKLTKYHPDQIGKNIELFKSKIRLTANFKAPEFHNARLSHKTQTCLYQMESPLNSSEKLERVKMQANSVLTAKGIQTIDYERFKSYACERKDIAKLYKTAAVTPSKQSSYYPAHFEIYDRKRRVIID